MATATTHNRDLWTAEKVSELIAYWLGDMPVTEIAVRFGVTPQAVKTRAGRSSLPAHVCGKVDLSEYPNWKIRRCKCCTYEFFSEHKGLRLCDDCKRSDLGDGWMVW